jgi:CheY-like chemotaxis protein
MNLLSNAIKFTRSGEISVVASIRRADESELRPMLHVDVSDSGVGIRDDKIEEIFEPFVQVDASVTRRVGGTGLGLAISRRIAVMLGGDLTVTSTLGEGTTFHLAIDPGDLDGVEFVSADDARSFVTPESSTADAPEKLGPVNILLVEDGDTNRRYVSLALERSGAKVDTAENGRFGVDLALARDYDLVLMDMQMPVMDGFTATRLLRESGYTRPIVALTANAMTGDREKCMAAGCTEFLTKPIHYDELLAALSLQLKNESTTQLPAVPTAAATTEGDVVSRLPCEDDPEFQEIVSEFVRTLHQKLAVMEAALQSNDLQEVALLAHWLKGSGGTAGFHEFTEPAAELEQAARGRLHGRCVRKMEAICSIANRIVLPWQHAMTIHDR